MLIDFIRPFGPWVALAILYGVTLFATEFLSNAAVAMLITRVAVALAESLGVEPRPFLVAVMMAASNRVRDAVRLPDQCARLLTRQTQVHGFRRVGVPLNLLTWVAGVIAIPYFFPF